MPGTASGETPCARHRRSLCLLRSRHNNFVLDRSRGSPNKKMKFFRSPIESTHGLGAAASRFRVPRQTGRKRETLMNLNLLTIIGFIGRNAGAGVAIVSPAAILPSYAHN